jgi:tRNA A37 threonylcarbamoyladenosine dehydratase
MSEKDLRLEIFNTLLTMAERFLHENIYRGTSTMKKLKQTPVALCGVGAVGSNLAVNLVR